MLAGCRRGPKPSKWKKGASDLFASFFARRSEVLNPDDQEPLVEVSGSGSKWIFTPFADEPRQVNAAVGSTVRNIALCVTGALVCLGSGQEPGEGTCEAYWVVDEEEL